MLEQPGTRNANNGSWWRKVDMRVSKEFPGFADSHRGSAYVVIDNLTNLINDDWGVMYEANFPYGVTQDDIADGRAESRIGDASLWEVRVGLTTVSNPQALTRGALGRLFRARRLMPRGNPAIIEPPRPLMSCLASATCLMRTMMLVGI